jgi:hypothetical protein
MPTAGWGILALGYAECTFFDYTCEQKIMITVTIAPKYPYGLKFLPLKLHNE